MKGVYDSLLDLLISEVSVHPEVEGHVLTNVEKIEEGAVLEHEGDTLAKLLQLSVLQLQNIDAVVFDDPFVWLHESDESLDEDGLSLSGRAENHHGLVVTNIQGDPLQDVLFLEALFHPDGTDHRSHSPR